jgi:hypothetical protein
MFIRQTESRKMGKLATIRNIHIRVYANDHLPPHFHVIAPDFEALVEISTMSILAGNIPTAGKEAMEWAIANRALIVVEWNRINPRFPTA